jgi:hypothetical protein
VNLTPFLITQKSLVYHNINPILHQAVVFNRPKLLLVQLWHLITNHSTIFELEWHGSQLSGAKAECFYLIRIKFYGKGCTKKLHRF